MSVSLASAPEANRPSHSPERTSGPWPHGQVYAWATRTWAGVRAVLQPARTRASPAQRWPAAVTLALAPHWPGRPSGRRTVHCAPCRRSHRPQTRSASGHGSPGPRTGQTGVAFLSRPTLLLRVHSKGQRWPPANRQLPRSPRSRLTRHCAPALPASWLVPGLGRRKGQERPATS